MDTFPSNTAAQDVLLALTEDTFDRIVLASERPVFVEFWAEWCSVCKVMTPILRDLAQTLAGRVTVATLDVEAYPDLAEVHPHIPGVTGAEGLRL